MFIIFWSFNGGLVSVCYFVMKLFVDIVIGCKNLFINIGSFSCVLICYIGSLEIL